MAEDKRDPALEGVLHPLFAGRARAPAPRCVLARVFVFERDVARQPLPEPYSKGKKENMEVRVYSRERDVDQAKTAVAAMGELGPEEIDTQLNRGDAVAIASAAGEPAGYGWLRLSMRTLVTLGLPGHSPPAVRDLRRAGRGLGKDIDGLCANGGDGCGSDPYAKVFPALGPGKGCRRYSEPGLAAAGGGSRCDALRRHADGLHVGRSAPPSMFASDPLLTHSRAATLITLVGICTVAAGTTAPLLCAIGPNRFPFTREVCAAKSAEGGKTKDYTRPNDKEAVGYFHRTPPRGFADAVTVGPVSCQVGPG
jgi:hypothetical protein